MRNKYKSIICSLLLCSTLSNICAASDYLDTYTPSTSSKVGLFKAALIGVGLMSMSTPVEAQVDGCCDTVRCIQKKCFSDNTNDYFNIFYRQFFHNPPKQYLFMGNREFISREYTICQIEINNNTYKGIHLGPFSAGQEYGNINPPWSDMRVVMGWKPIVYEYYLAIAQKDYGVYSISINTDQCNFIHNYMCSIRAPQITNVKKSCHTGQPSLAQSLESFYGKTLYPTSYPPTPRPTHRPTRAPTLIIDDIIDNSDDNPLLARDPNLPRLPRLFNVTH